MAIRWASAFPFELVAAGAAAVLVGLSIWFDWRRFPVGRAVFGLLILGVIVLAASLSGRFWFSRLAEVAAHPRRRRRSGTGPGVAFTDADFSELAFNGSVAFDGAEFGYDLSSLRGSK